MKKIVIAGSAKLQDEINSWIDKFEKDGYYVLDYPQKIEENSFIKQYPNIHKEFFENIINTDILFVMNEDKNNIEGYIGAETFAELAFGLSQNLLYEKNIDLVILKMPDEKVGCYNEIKLWLELGWIKMYK